MEDQSKIHYHVPESFQDVEACFMLACDKHPHSGPEPYEYLCSYRNQKIVCLKICKEHGDVVTTAIKIHSPRDIEILRLKPGVESMIGN